MFKEIKNNWLSSEKLKSDKLEYLKSLHNNMLLVKELSDYVNMEGSCIDSFTVDNKGVYITLDESRFGTKMYFDDYDSEEAPVEVMCSLDYEKVESETIFSVIDLLAKDKNLTVFDIGANVGWYSLTIKNHLPASVIYSFEPSPITFSRLKNNMVLNGQDTDRVFNIGFYDQKDQMEFYYDVEGSGGSSFKNLRERENVKKIIVDVDTIENFVKENKVEDLDFIKCDVEGAELFVFKGGIDFIKKTKPVIFSEMLRKWSAKFSYTPNDIIELLKSIGYECYAISGTKKIRYCPIVDDETVETNYLFLDPDKHSEIIDAMK